MALSVTYRVDRKPSAPVRLSLGKSSAPLGDILNAAPPGEWRTLKVKLSCFRRDGEDLAAVTAPVTIASEGALSISVSELRLTPNQNDAVCP
jgi:beta-glucosidase